MLDGDFARPRLLAIDDDLVLAELITRAAEKCGYEARALDTSRDLSKLLEDFIPDVITLDLSMPDEDGLGLLQVLEKRRFSGPLVIVSGHQDWLRKAACRLAAGRGFNVANDFRNGRHGLAVDAIRRVRDARQDLERPGQVDLIDALEQKRADLQVRVMRDHGHLQVRNQRWTRRK